MIHIAFCYNFKGTMNLFKSRKLLFRKKLKMNVYFVNMVPFCKPFFFLRGIETIKYGIYSLKRKSNSLASTTKKIMMILFRFALNLKLWSFENTEKQHTVLLPAAILTYKSHLMKPLFSGSTPVQYLVWLTAVQLFNRGFGCLSHCSDPPAVKNRV